MYNEYKDLTLDCPEAPEPCRFQTGMDVLRYFNMEDTDIALDISILFGLGVFYRILFAFILEHFHTGKK